jgi:DNA-binding response OmpR family regulator
VVVRVLLIEDEPDVARVVRGALDAEGFAVDVRGNGEEGLQLATSSFYDAIILDWNLPALDGLSVLKKLRKAGRATRVIFLSGRRDVADRVCALQAGADDFLVKPFSIDELLARLHAILRRPEAVLDKLTVGDLELDRRRGVATRAGKPIHLTQREYAVLEYLMRNEGHLVTRSMVIEHVWDMHYEGMTNIVDSYIAYLRAKIDRGFDKPLIHTKHGLGYYISDKESPRS